MGSQEFGVSLPAGLGLLAELSLAEAQTLESLSLNRSPTYSRAQRHRRATLAHRTPHNAWDSFEVRGSGLRVLGQLKLMAWG